MIAPVLGGSFDSHSRTTGLRSDVRSAGQVQPYGAEESKINSFALTPPPVR
jgi:hypothetical protein